MAKPKKEALTMVDLRPYSHPARTCPHTGWSRLAAALILLVAQGARAGTLVLQHETLTDPSQGTVLTILADEDIAAGLFSTSPGDYPLRLLSFDIMVATPGGSPETRLFDITIYGEVPTTAFSGPSAIGSTRALWRLDDVALVANQFTTVDASVLDVIVPCGVFAVGIRPAGPGTAKPVCDNSGCSALTDKVYDASEFGGHWDTPCPLLTGALAIRVTVETNAGPFPSRAGEVLSATALTPPSGTAGTGFGASVVSVGDLDGNGSVDLAVGAPLDDEAAANSGAVWILFLDASGTVIAEQKINGVQGGLSNAPSSGAHFGQGVAALGDFDGDGIPDLAVGGPVDSECTAGLPMGAVWLLFLNANGTVKSERKILPCVDLSLGGGWEFGYSLTALGDIDGNGVTDIAVGCPGYRLGFETNIGAIIVIELLSDGSVDQSRTAPGDLLANVFAEGGDRFGHAITRAPDLNGDGIADLYVTAPGAGGIYSRPDNGIYYSLRVTTSGFGVVHQATYILPVHWRRQGGQSIALLDDLDGSGHPDIAVGSSGDGPCADALFDGSITLYLVGNNGVVRISEQRITAIESGVTLPSGFCSSLGSLGDFDGNGACDIVAGDGAGSVSLIFLRRSDPVSIRYMYPNFGIASGGTTHTIRGAGFTSVGDTTVHFGGAPATVLNVTPTEMMVQTPALPAGNRVDIIVANSQGSCEIERVFSVQPCPSVSISSVDPSSGREIGGEVVAIRGSNLDLGGTVQVFFGAVEAEVRFQSTPQVRVTAPPGTGTVDVRVVTGCGEAVRIGGYTYVPCGPALTSLSPLSGREPGGIAVTLIGSNFDVGTTTVTFGGVPATVMSVTSTEIEVINPAGSGPVQVVVETDCGPSNVRFFTYNACNPVTITLVEPATGAESGDTHVHVRGGGLHQDSVQEVLFGGVPATIVRRPSGQVIVRTPPGIGTVDVSVRNDCDTVVAAGAYTYLPDEIAARLGNVNVDDGDRADVLLVNSSAGDGNRVVQVNIGEPIALEILAPPSRSVAKYAVWGFAGTPTAGTVFSSPFDLGLFAFAPPFGGGAPVVVWNTIGRRPLLGTPDFASPDAPATLFTHPGLNHGVTVTFLGLVRDDAARIPEGFASANAVVLEVQ